VADFLAPTSTSGFVTSGDPAPKSVVSPAVGTRVEVVVASRAVERRCQAPQPGDRAIVSGEERKIFTLHVGLYQGLHLVPAHSAERECDAEY
jgi:hypothetical protein